MGGPREWDPEITFVRHIFQVWLQLIQWCGRSRGLTSVSEEGWGPRGQEGKGMTGLNQFDSVTRTSIA